MSVSCCLITWNEEESISRCLKYIDSLKYITEICIVDSNSTDKTQDIIYDFIKMSEKHVVFISKEFKNFEEHRNMSLDLATSDWVITIDADETYTQQLDSLLADLPLMSTINAVRIPTITMAIDTRHYIDSGNLDPHVRIFRRGFARLKKLIHEELVDNNGRSLHWAKNIDILNILDDTKHYNVYMKHHQLLKSSYALLSKGERWEELGFIAESAKAGIPVHKNIWNEWKITSTDKSIKELPLEWYDSQT